MSCSCLIMATWQPPSDKCTARTRRSVRRPRERGHGSVWIGRWKEEDISDSLLWEREWGPYLGELLTVADSLLPPLWLLKLLRFAWIDYPLLGFIFKLWYLDVRLTLLPLILYRPPVMHKVKTISNTARVLFDLPCSTARPLILQDRHGRKFS